MNFTFKISVWAEIYPIYITRRTRYELIAYFTPNGFLHADQIGIVLLHDSEIIPVGSPFPIDHQTDGPRVLPGPPFRPSVGEGDNRTGSVPGGDRIPPGGPAPGHRPRSVPVFAEIVDEDDS